MIQFAKTKLGEIDLKRQTEKYNVIREARRKELELELAKCKKVEEELEREKKALIAAMKIPGGRNKHKEGLYETRVKTNERARRLFSHQLQQMTVIDSNLLGNIDTGRSVKFLQAEAKVKAALLKTGLSEHQLNEVDKGADISNEVADATREARDLAQNRATEEEEEEEEEEKGEENIFDKEAHLELESQLNAGPSLHDREMEEQRRIQGELLAMLESMRLSQQKKAKAKKAATPNRVD